MKNLPPAIKADAIGISVAAACAAAAYFALVEPSRQQQAEASRLRAELADVEAMAVSAEGSIRVREDGSKRQRVELASLGVVLKPLAHLNHRVQAITELAGARGVQVEQVRPGNPEGDALSTCIPITLTGATTFAEAMAFVADLRKQFPDVSISGLRMQRAAAPLGETPARVGVEFNLAWHALPADPAGGANPRSTVSAESR